MGPGLAWSPDKKSHRVDEISELVSVLVWEGRTVTTDNYLDNSPGTRDIQVSGWGRIIISGVDFSNVRCQFLHLAYPGGHLRCGGGGGPG